MSNDSGTLGKFGIRPESRVSLLGIRDAAFLRLVLPQVLNPAQHRAVKGSDFIFLGVEAPKQLERLRPLCKYLNPGGCFWIVFPKDSPQIGLPQIFLALLHFQLAYDEIVNFSESHQAVRICPID